MTSRYLQFILWLFYAAMTGAVLAFVLAWTAVLTLFWLLFAR
jgi:hypothetical protein